MPTRREESDSHLKFSSISLQIKNEHNEKDGCAFLEAPLTVPFLDFLEGESGFWVFDGGPRMPTC